MTCKCFIFSTESQINIFGKVACSLAKLKKLSFKVSVLAALFALTCYLAFDAVTVMMPIFVQVLPEGWALPSYKDVIFDVLGNAGLLLFFTLRKIFKKRLKLEHVIYCSLILSSVCTIVLAFCWRKTAVVGRSEHSVAFFIIFFVMSCLSRINNASYLPYMARYPKEYLVFVNFGIGISTTITSLFALAQGINEIVHTCPNEAVPPSNSSNNTYNLTLPEPNNRRSTNVTHRQTDTFSPRFSVATFLLIIASLYAIGLLSFVGLNNFRFSMRHIVNTEELIEDQEHPRSGKPRRKLVLLLVARGWTCLLLSTMYPLLSYASLPYGVSIFYFATIIGIGMVPVSNVLYLFLPLKSVRSITILTGVTTILVFYLVVLAAMSPCPILLHHNVGGILVVSRLFDLYADCGQTRVQHLISCLEYRLLTFLHYLVQCKLQGGVGGFESDPCAIMLKLHVFIFHRYVLILLPHLTLS